jgi:iron complex transport system ATP-binding protein
MNRPTAWIFDLQRQLEVLSIVQRITKARGITTLIALHDLNLASRYADRFVVMSHEMVYASGRDDSVLTPEMLEDVYGVHAEVSMDSHGEAVVTPICSARNRMANREPEYAQLAV